MVSRTVSVTESAGVKRYS